MAVNLYMCLIVVLSVITANIGAEHMPGGYSDIDPNSDEAKETSKFAVNEFNEESNDQNVYKYLKTVHAESQVVNGINYRLTVEIGKTQCKKYPNSGYGGIPRCDVGKSYVSQVYSCLFIVYKSPIQDGQPPRKYLKKHDCKPK